MVIKIKELDPKMKEIIEREEAYGKSTPIEINPNPKEYSRIGYGGEKSLLKDRPRPILESKTSQRTLETKIEEPAQEHKSYFTLEEMREQDRPLTSFKEVMREQKKQKYDRRQDVIELRKQQAAIKEAEKRYQEEYKLEKIKSDKARKERILKLQMKSQVMREKSRIRRGSIDRQLERQFASPKVRPIRPASIQRHVPVSIRPTRPQRTQIRREFDFGMGNMDIGFNMGAPINPMGNLKGKKKSGDFLGLSEFF